MAYFSCAWLATLRLDGAYGTSPSVPVDRFRRSRSTSDEKHPTGGSLRTATAEPPYY